jgi:serine/threonine protein kinase/tetratricopeptide (TPR) repeat protein
MSLNPDNVGSGTAAGERAQVAGTCPVCGRPLTQLGPNAECLRCLFNWGLEDEPPDEKSTARTKRSPAQLKYAHFEVEVGADGLPIELGAGAMAVTYRAWDTVLNCVVALKVIERKVAENSAGRSRFLREARAAAQIQHPNVARVTHYGEQDGECFYAMELVDGETLEARVRRDGPLPLALALEVIEQTARGLVAGEACGVVHRDLKPSNVMIMSDQSGQVLVKIIDYGVAKVATDATVETQVGFIGTPAFASPEQFSEAGHQQIDTRSDIYSLGVTFWYLVTGRTPFPGGSIEEIRAKQTEQLPLEQLKRAHIPMRVMALLKSMLAIDTGRRPQTARELFSAVHRCVVHFDKARSRRRRFAFAAAAALLIATTILFVTWRYNHVQSSTQVDKSIAILPFESLSADKENAYLAEGIQSVILTRLSKIADLRVVSHTSTQHYSSKPLNLPEVAKQLGVAHVLEGSVQKSGDAVRVNVQLIKGSTGSNLWADTFDRATTDIFWLESEVAGAVADKMQARLSGDEKLVVAAKPTDNAEAYDAYLRGLSLSLKPGFIGAEDAQRYLKQAVQLDSKFALAWAELSIVDSGAYITSNLPRTDALRDEARQTAETAIRLQPKLGEALLAKGVYYYGCLGDYATATRYYQEAARLLPNDGRIPQVLAYVERRRAHWEQSETYFNQAERIDPRNPGLVFQHGLFYLCLRRFPEALREFEQTLNITPDDVWALACKASVFQAQGDLSHAAAILGRLKPTDDLARGTQAYQAILERHTARIITAYQAMLAGPHAASALDHAKGLFWLGWAQAIAGDFAAASESYSQARNELEIALKEQSSDYELMDYLALTNAALGNKSAAIELAERAMAGNSIEKDSVSAPRSIEILARVTSQTGDHDRAIAALQHLLSMPYVALLGGRAPLTSALLQLDPMFDPLRNDPRFKTLIEGTPTSSPR